MPTSDADRYAQLLQNLAVRIGAIREAIERTLPNVATLNAEFEIITNAIEKRTGPFTGEAPVAGEKKGGPPGGLDF
jgi:hypothetical protein